MIFYESYYGVAGLGQDTIAHVGVKGTHWGVRRWQYEDGSLTPAGRVHYGVGEDGHKLSRSEKHELKRGIKADEHKAKEQEKLQKYKSKENKKLDKRYDKKLSKLDKKTDKLAEKYSDAANKGKSDRKLKKIANKYEKVSTKLHDRTMTKAEERREINTKKSMKEVRRERRSKRWKGFKGYIGWGTLAGMATLGGSGVVPGLVVQGLRRGKYRERIRVDKNERKAIAKQSAIQAAKERAALEKKRRR